MGTEDKKEDFLSNLGRATMRGLRRCKKCGTLNGTRGYSCKNSSCNVIFKNIVKKATSEPCKIIGGSYIEIYSVRIRDKGPDYRGFVQLPRNSKKSKVEQGKALMYSAEMHDKGQDCREFGQLPSLSENHLVSEEIITHELLSHTHSNCYIESCFHNHKSQHRSGSCTHIRAAIMCEKHAEPLVLKQSILNSFPMSSDIRSEMLELATDTSGPLVQRISKSVMVVKCKPSYEHPLGFLHFTFKMLKSKMEKNVRFLRGCRICTCPSTKSDSLHKCVHFYACLVAFASDDNLSKEFSYFIGLAQSDPPKQSRPPESGAIEEPEEEEPMHKDDEETEAVSATESSLTLCSVETTSADKEGGVLESEALEEVDERSFLILNHDPGSVHPCQMEVEVDVLRDDSDSIHMPIEEDAHISPEDEIESKLEIQLKSEDGIHLQSTNGDTLTVHQLPEAILFPQLKPLKSSVKSPPIRILKSPSKNDGKKSSVSFIKKSYVSETDVKFTFSSWLESVREKINQTMHYGFSGTPDPLVFHIPKTFFWCLMERINGITNLKKQKVQHDSQTLIRKDAIPLGKFIKFSWKLTSLEQVQHVFMCNGKTLETTQYFLRQNDGSYKPSLQQIVPEEEQQLALQSGTTPIQPSECKTVLRVGQVSLFKEPVVPFIIEWIPDILPRSQIGELWIKFEFDHYFNGQQVKPLNVLVSKPSQKVTKSMGPPLAPRPPANKTPLSVPAGENIISIPISSENIPNEGITILTF